MPSNVEIKAKVHDLEKLKLKAKELSGEDGTLIKQQDTFFNVPDGRLKLRCLQEKPSQLIYYERSDSSGPKLSNYYIATTSQPKGMIVTLKHALGVKGQPLLDARTMGVSRKETPVYQIAYSTFYQGVVKKERYLYMVGQTRVHVDHVEGLGDFMELETYLKPAELLKKCLNMAKVVISPSVHNFADIRPVSRGLSFSSRPKSGLSAGHSRPQSGINTRAEKLLEGTPRSERSPTSVDIPLPVSGRRSLSVSSLSSTGKSNVYCTFACSKSPNPKLSAIEVESIMRDKIRVNFADIRQAFQTLDADRNLTVTQLDDTPGEFRRVLESFCFPLSQEQFHHIMKKAVINRDGTVNYLEFLEKLHLRGGTPEGMKWLGSLHRFNQAKTPEEQPFDDIESKIKAKISGQLQSVLKALRLFDYNRDEQIQRHELRRVLENFCFKLTENQFDRLWCKYDMTRNSNTLNYMDFLQRLGVDTKKKTVRHHSNKATQGKGGVTQEKVRFVATNKRPCSSSSSREGSPAPVPAPPSIKDLEMRLRKLMIENYHNITRAFVAFDRRGDGFVTLSELKRVLSHFVFPMTDGLFNVLMQRCGIKANHKIAYEQFLNKFQEPKTDRHGQTLPLGSNHKVNPIREAEIHPTTEDIWKFLFSKVTDSFSSIKQAFLVFDDNKDGRVTRRDFRRILESFCYRMTEEQFHELMAKIDPRNNGYISYQEFLERFEHRETEEGHPWLIGDHSPKSISPPAILAWSTVEDILRGKIMENWKTIASAYISIDDNRDGSISREELRKLLEKYCLPLSDEHYEMLWGRCDLNEDNSVDFQEFLSNLGVDIISGDINGISTRIHDESEANAHFMKYNQYHRQEAAYDRAVDLTGQKSADKCMDILKEHISQRSPDIRKTFVKFDNDGDGKISRKEFRLVLDSLGLYTTDDQFRILSARLGFHKGKLSYRDFLDHFQDRRSLVSEKELLNIQSKACITSGNCKYMYCATHNQPLPLEESMTAEEVEAKLKAKLRDGFTDLRVAFQKIDFDRNGLITRQEFRRILDSLMFMLSDEEFEKLMKRFDMKKGDKLNYREFLKRFEHVEKIEEGHPWLYSNHFFNETKDLQYLDADYADRLLKRKALEQIEDITKAFLAFDQDGNGVVTKKELRKVLYKYQIALTKEEFKKLWEKYDTDNNGHIDHQEFIARLGGEFVPGDTHGPSTQITHGSYNQMKSFHDAQQAIHENATHNQAQAVSFLSALEVEQRLKDRFRDGYESLRKAFEAVDVNRDGYISRQELQQILFDFHFFLDEVQLNILLERCGLAIRNKLSYEKFLSAFEDQRYSGYGRVTLDTPNKQCTSPVVFENHESLNPDQAIAKLRKKISSNYDTIVKAFHAFDDTGLGFISAKDLHQIINAFCFVMTDKQFRALLKQIVINKDGLLSYEDFLHSFQQTDTEASRKWLENLLPSPTNEHRSPLPKHGMTEQDVETRVKEVVMARFYTLAKALTEQDTGRTGLISKRSLKRVLDRHVFRMNEEQFDHIWQSLPNAPDDSVDYREFLKKYSSRTNITRASSATPPRTQERKSSRESLLSPMMSPNRNISPEIVTPPMSASDVEKRLKNQVCRCWQQLQKSFRNTDHDNTGTISFEQLRDILYHHSMDLTHSELLALCRKHDSDGKGRIIYKDFLRHFVLSMKSEETNQLKRAKLQPTKVPSSPGFKSDQLLEIMATMRSKVREDWKKMRRAFRAVDTEGTGNCSPSEFRQMLKRFHIDLNNEEFFHIYSYYDKNMLGKISYNEFLRAHLG
ncbi:hypothetical protein QZH41_020531 [Actinostola sp. cb2023]|nr:hypothetical protein QZH41_020531 [Actinostola sp. cb2023]